MSWSSRVRLVLLFVLSAMLGACGFHLRGQATYTFSSIYVNTTGAPVFQSELKRALEGAGSAKLAATAAAADVILDIPAIVDEKDVLSLSAGGSVREFSLLMAVGFRIQDKEGSDLLQPGEVM